MLNLNMVAQVVKYKLLFFITEMRGLVLTNHIEVLKTHNIMLNIINLIRPTNQNSGREFNNCRPFFFTSLDHMISIDSQWKLNTSLDTIEWHLFIHIDIVRGGSFVILFFVKWWKVWRWLKVVSANYFQNIKT